MPGFLQPDPLILAFLALKQTTYLPLLVVIALLRLIGGGGRAPRLLAALALLLAGAGIAVQVLPAMFGLYGNPLVAVVDTWRKAWGGMASLLCASAPLLLSALPRTSRWWLLDLLHGALLGATLALWGWSVWG